MQAQPIQKYQDYQAIYSATLLHHYHQGKHQAEEPWYEAQPNCRKSENTQLPSSVQCAPTYCILEPGSNGVAVGLRNILAKSITIPSRAVVGQLQQAKMVPNVQASKLQDKEGPNRGKEGTWGLDQLNLEVLNS